MIVLNTNLYYESNKVVSELDDPADHFIWLEDELTKAATDNKKVSRCQLVFII